MSEQLVVGSTFSGVGGFDLGLERAGMRIAFTAENDAWCRSVLSHYWSEAHHYADVRDVEAVGTGSNTSEGWGSGRELERGPDQERPVPCDGNQVGGIDLLCGGFPCQDLSVAGQRAGLAGARSGLFFEFARIADELKPRWVLLENVPGLLSSDGGRDFGIVLETLAEIGYGCAWRVLDSRYFGVPQRRRRVFVVGHLGGDSEYPLRALCEGCGGDLETGRCSWQEASIGSRGCASGHGDQVSTLQGAPGRGYRIDVEAAAGGHLIPLHNGVSVTLTKNGAQSLDPEYEPLLPSIEGVRRLTPLECERLQSFPDGWTDIEGIKCPDSRRYAAMGNAVTVNVIEWIGRRILAVDQAAA